MAVWAQSANAYRRYVPKAYVSLAAHWGFNNRTVALRIPRGHGSATRIEHRVAGADANPYSCRLHTCRRRATASPTGSILGLPSRATLRR